MSNDGKKRTMSPFISKDEEVAFSAIGDIEEGDERSPLLQLDITLHAQKQLYLLGPIPGSIYNDMMARLDRTFREGAKAPGGGVLHMVSEGQK